MVNKKHTHWCICADFKCYLLPQVEILPILTLEVYYINQRKDSVRMANQEREQQPSTTETTFQVSGSQPVDYEALRENIVAQFPMIQILDKEGNIINEEIIPELSDEEFVELMEKMVFARTLHEETMKFSRQGRLGFYGPTLGQEASEMGTVAAFEKEDWLYGAYRDIPQLIAHGANISQGFNWSRGHVHGGTYGDNGEVNAMVPQIIIGAQYIQAAGNAIGQKLNGSDQVTFTYTGDGGSSQGDFYEGLNFAGRYKAPAVFIIQNNGYAISTPREKATAATTLAQKGVAAGIPSVQVDGMDILATYAVTKQAREWAAAGNGPVLIETITSRMAPHSTAGDDPSRYRDQESFDYWEDRDPLKRYRKFLTDKGLWDEEKEAAIKAEYVQQIADAIVEAEEQPVMKISETLKWQYANPPQFILDQIAYYEEKGE